jgi:hypothetical protein
MKPTIIVKGHTHVEILRALLPVELVKACRLLAIGARSTMVSVARTHLIKYRAPTAMLLETGTLEPTIIAETIQTTRYVISAVAGDTPFAVIDCIPHIEVIFFEDTAVLQRIFPNFANHFILQFARTQPKDQLEFLFQEGGGPGNLKAFLDQLTSEEIEKLRASQPIQQAMAFIMNNAEIVAQQP